jgi:hypothetical protein
MDRRERERFVAKYAEMHRLVREPNGTTVLYVGAENWPFPFPLVARGERWRFDTAAGQREITFRRIGANEATAIEVCHAATEAPAHGGTSAAGTDSIATYAERLAAAARTGGRAPGHQTADTPFQGYRFVVGAAGSESSSSRYRTTGVMTFVVDDDVSYERDLGPETGRVVRTLGTSDVGLARRRMTIAALPTPCWILTRPIARWVYGSGTRAPVYMDSASRKRSWRHGKLKENVAPGPGFDSAHSRPPWASMIERLIAKPMPMPCGLVV